MKSECATRYQDTAQDTAHTEAAHNGSVSAGRAYPPGERIRRRVASIAGRAPANSLLQLGQAKWLGEDLHLVGRK